MLELMGRMLERETGLVINSMTSATVLNEHINKVYEKRSNGVAYLFDLPLLFRRSITKARKREKNLMTAPETTCLPISAPCSCQMVLEQPDRRMEDEW